MAPKTIYGRSIVCDEPVMSPMRSPNGRPVPFRNTRELLLDDGSTVYGCGYDGCEFWSPNPYSVRPHLKVHTGKRAKAAAAQPPARPGAFTAKPSNRRSTANPARTTTGSPPAPPVHTATSPTPAISGPLNTTEIVRLLSLGRKWETDGPIVIADRDRWRERALAAERRADRAERDLAPVRQRADVAEGMLRDLHAALGPVAEPALAKGA